MDTLDPISRGKVICMFNLPNADLEAEFVAEAAKQGMLGLKGHRSVGGIRASIYNAAKLEWVQALTDFMADFHKGS